jgi:CHAT domain-containing protein
MVVLSGCETGLGQVQTGEGVIGLGRAFAYAGTRSLAFSLWSVSDAAASRLMPDFYGLLRQGLPKQAALRQAKIKLLDQGLSPFFWAPFVLYGDGRAIF